MSPLSKSKQPISLVIFGASGDLTQRKLIPALFNLYRKNLLPETFQIIGFARRDYDDEIFRNFVKDGMLEFAPAEFNAEEWEPFAQRIFYFKGDLSTPTDYERLSEALSNYEAEPSNRLYYLATAPRFFPIIIEQLGARGMATEDGAWRHVVIEKPFGRDLASARALNTEVQAVFSENQIYRIDHYLGKETVQNILTFRFANTIFEPLWNRNYIDHVQIMVAESVGVGHRAGYYDQAGVIRDMFQNHILQLVALTASEPPGIFNAKSLRDEKVKVLNAISPIKTSRTIWGQYHGYADEPGVAPGSITPTYLATKLYIDNWRWQGVPFYIRSGKNLAAKNTSITLIFKSVPHFLFPEEQAPEPNRLSLCIQPDEGIHLTFAQKIPGAGMQTEEVDMDFHYDTGFDGIVLPDAYERLLLDALKGDASLFARADEIERAWETGTAPPTVYYAPGTWGPKESEVFIQLDGRDWHEGCVH